MSETAPAADVVTLDLASLTLGEMAAVEKMSGEDFAAMLTRGAASRRLLALAVHELRTSAQPRSWSDLCSLRLSDASSSTSPSPADGPSETASD